MKKYLIFQFFLLSSVFFGSTLFAQKINEFPKKTDALPRKAEMFVDILPLHE